LSRMLVVVMMEKWRGLQDLRGVKMLLHAWMVMDMRSMMMPRDHFLFPMADLIDGGVRAKLRGLNESIAEDF
jgi:hypothetical protein